MSKTITRYYDVAPDDYPAELVVLDQLIAELGLQATITGFRAVFNGSGREVGEEYDVSLGTAELIRDAIETMQS